MSQPPNEQFTESEHKIIKSFDTLSTLLDDCECRSLLARMLLLIEEKEQRWLDLKLAEVFKKED